MIRFKTSLIAALLAPLANALDTAPTYCTTVRISTSSSGAQANGPSRLSSLSPDWSWAAFESTAADLVVGDANGASDVFLKSVATGELILVSRALGGGTANGASDHATASTNGNFVLFESDASNLVTGDTNGLRDVFLFERATGAITRVSVAPSGAEGNGPSGSAGLDRGSDLSDDGNRIVFTSSATNFVAGDTGGFTDVFVLDRASGVLTCVTVDGLSAFANGDSLEPSISGNGAVVAFASEATNLVAADTNGARDVFVSMVGTGVFHLASRESSGVQGNGDSGRPSLNLDGSIVAFESTSTNLVAGDTNGARDVFMHTPSTGATARVSVDPGGGQANAASGAPSIHATAPLIAFSSFATNLLPGGNSMEAVYSRFENFFVPNTVRVSLDSAGSPGIGGSREPSHGAFTSDAALVPGDTNGVSDIYLRRCGATGTIVCVGTALTCPCGNASNFGVGCVNSSGLGGTLTAQGVPSVFADSVTLIATGLPPNAPVLFFRGASSLAGGVPFGDGLRCVVGGVRRLAVRTAHAQGVATFGAQPGDPLISVVGIVPAAGGTQHYQAWYRDTASFCTAATFNLTNAYRIDWAP